MQNNLFSWGSNYYGNLGTGNTIDNWTPRLISSTTWKQIYSGYYSSLQIRETDSKLFQWGYNGVGILGIGNTTEQWTPIPVPGTTIWKQIHLSTNQHCLQIRETDSILFSWGSNLFGCLGIGTLSIINQWTPIEVPGTTAWKQIQGGANYSLQLRETDSMLFQWGCNTYGTLGIGNYVLGGSSSENWTPIAIESTVWKQIQTGTEQSLQLRETDSMLFQWGWNNYGELGIGNVVNPEVGIWTPTLVCETSWKSVIGGHHYSLQIRDTDSNLFGWGINDNGQLGIGSGGTTIGIWTPIPIIGTTAWKQIQACDIHSLQMRETDSMVFQWGSNYYGKLGIGNEIDSWTPIPIIGSTVWKQISVGYISSIQIGPELGSEITPIIITNPSPIYMISDVDQIIEWDFNNSISNIKFNFYIDNIKQNIEEQITDLSYTINLNSPTNSITTHTIKVTAFTNDENIPLSENSTVIIVGHEQEQSILVFPIDEQIDVSSENLKFEWDYNGVPDLNNGILFDFYLDKIEPLGLGKSNILNNKNLGDSATVYESDILNNYYILGGLDLDQEYEWKIVSKSDFTPSGTPSIVQSFTTKNCINGPSNFNLSIPIDLSIKQELQDLKFEWNSATNQTYYELYLKKDSDDNYTLIETNILITDYTITSLILEQDTLYSWKIKQINDCDSTETDVFQFTTKNCNNEYPIDFQISNINNLEVNVNNNFTVEWNSQESDTIKITKYDIYIGIDENTISKVFEIYDPELRNFTYLGELNTIYYCYIKQINDCGEKDTPTISFTTIEFNELPYVQLESPTIDERVNNNPQIIWSQANYTHFTIYVSKNLEFEDGDIKESDFTLLTYQLEDLDQDTTYYWQIIQHNLKGQTLSDKYYFKTHKYNTTPTNIILISPEFNEQDIELNPLFEWSQENQESYDLKCYKIIYDEECEILSEDIIINITNIINAEYLLLTDLEYTFNQQCLKDNSDLMTHKWIVTQKNSMGNADSQYSYFRMKICYRVPDAPTLLSPIDNFVKEINDDLSFEWLQVLKQDYYKIYLGESNTTLELIVDNYIDNQILISQERLEPNKTYYWQISQVNSCGESLQSNIKYFRTISCQNLPDTPTLQLPNKYQTNIIQKNIVLKWSPILNQDSYDIYLSYILPITVNHKINDIVVTTNNYLITDLDTDKTYYWKVIQKNECGNSEFSQTYNFTTQQCKHQPQAFNLLTPLNYKDFIPNAAVLRWEEQDEQIDYYIYFKNIIDIDFELLYISNYITDYTVRNLDQDEVYEWYVEQVNSCGKTRSTDNFRFFTSKQDECKLPTKPFNPEPLDHATNVQKNIYLNWHKSNGKEPIVYVIYLDTNNPPKEIINQQKEYQPQKINMYNKYSVDGIEEKIADTLVFSSYDITSDTTSNSNYALYPLFAPRIGSKLSYERYIYFKQDEIEQFSKINNLKLYNDLDRSYKNYISLYYKITTIYHAPTRNKIINSSMSILEPYPLNQNIPINGSIENNMSYINNKTDYCVLQLKIDSFIGHHGLKHGFLKLQYDEYVVETNLALTGNTTYYWSVVQKNECGESIGDIWQFTTIV